MGASERDRIVSLAAHLHPARGWGGVAVSAFNLSRWLHELGVLVAVLTTRSSRVGPDIDPPALAAEGLPGARTYRALPGAFCRRNAVAPALVPGLLRALWRHRTSAYLLVHGVGTFSAAVGPLVARILGVPYVIVAHGGLIESYRASFAHRRWKRLVYRLLVDPAVRSARLVVLTSDFERRSSNLPAHLRTAVIPNAVPVGPAVEVPPNLGPLRLCYVGRISPEKGVLEFANEFVGAARSDERLLIAGNGQGPYADALRVLASSDDRIRMVGELTRDELRGFVSDAHFLVLPTLLGSKGFGENFGNSVAEALAVGRPVLVSQGMAWDAVEREGIGFLLGGRRETVGQSLERMRSAVADEGHFQQMCRDAHRFAARFVDDEVYRSLLIELGLDAPARDGQERVRGW